MSLVTIKHEQGLQVTAAVRNHKLTLDTPVDEGGTDGGPAPVELLTAALGACMAMHIAKYCQTAKLPHEGFTIDLDFQLAPNPLRVGALTVDIILPPGVPDNRREAIKRAARQCTVKNSLKESTTIDIEVMAQPILTG
jgi:putative redox protein